MKPKRPRIKERILLASSRENYIIKSCTNVKLSIPLNHTKKSLENERNIK